MLNVGNEFIFQGNNHTQEGSITKMISSENIGI